MKKTPLFILVFILLTSCEQDNPVDPTPTTCNEPAATFKYKFDGALLEMNGSLSKNSVEGSYIRRVKDFIQPTTCSPYYSPTCSNYIYTLEATKWNLLDDEGNPILKITLRTAALSQGQTYTGRNNIYLTSYYPNNHTRNIYGSTDQFTTNFSLTITKMENGFADGTFSGEVKNSSGTNAYQITEGEFRNVKILQ